MKKNKSVECRCSMSFPKSLMVGKICYLCALNNWPPRTRKQLKDYEKAVSIRLSLVTPLTIDQGRIITKIVGLHNLQLLQDLIDGKMISHKPGATFYQRARAYLEATYCGK